MLYVLSLLFITFFSRSQTEYHKLRDALLAPIDQRTDSDSDDKEVGDNDGCKRYEKKYFKISISKPYVFGKLSFSAKILFYLIGKHILFFLQTSVSHSSTLVSQILCNTFYEKRFTPP